MANKGFIVDYSTDNEQFVLYEIQQINFSNLYSDDFYSQGEIKAYFGFNFVDCNTKYQDLDWGISFCKGLQRLLFGSFEFTREYNPNFIIITSHKELRENIAKVQNFYEKYNKEVVIKTDGFQSEGNLFISNEPFNVLRAKINELLLAECNYIIIEEKKMISPNYLKTKYAYLKDYGKVGIFRRDMIIYNKNELKMIEVTKAVLDTSKNTNSHEFYSAASDVGYSDRKFYMKGNIKKHLNKREQPNLNYRNRKKNYEKMVKVIDIFSNIKDLPKVLYLLCFSNINHFLSQSGAYNFIVYLGKYLGREIKIDDQFDQDVLYKLDCILKVLK